MAKNLKEPLLDPSASTAGANTVDGTVVLLPQEAREILSLMALLRESSVKHCLLPALATVASEMALDYEEAMQYLANLLRNLENEIKPDDDGVLRHTGNAAPTLALLDQVISHAPQGLFRPGTFPGPETLKKCLDMFHAKLKAKLAADR